MKTATILIQCPDQKGIIAKISNFIFKHDANIIQADQHSTDPENGRFFMRIEFYFDDAVLPVKNLNEDFSELAANLNASWKIQYKGIPLRMGILVSKYDHCLADILYRYQSGELNIEIPFVISNHNKVENLVNQYNIPFHHIPVNPDKKEAEAKILELVSDNTDFLVLARYMQIITPHFIEAYNKEIINIHHSFLPSFKGANPYRQAYERGVKIIGATSHYITENLDEGPIIEQSVQEVSHKDDVEVLKRKGRNLEKITLANAIHAHIESRIIRYLNKTIVFK